MPNPDRRSAFTLFLKKSGLRDTQQRRMVIETFLRAKHAMSAHDVERRIRAKGNTINGVTVYRILAILECRGLAHRHPCNGLYSLCSMAGKRGHHGFLHCTSCGGIEEFLSEKLCKLEDRIARSVKFRPAAHVREIVGTCFSCAA